MVVAVVVPKETRPLLLLQDEEIKEAEGAVPNKEVPDNLPGELKVLGNYKNDTHSYIFLPQ